jgi:hypothetical protein
MQKQPYTCSQYGHGDTFALLEATHLWRNRLFEEQVSTIEHFSWAHLQPNTEQKHNVECGIIPQERKSIPETFYENYFEM